MLGLMASAPLCIHEAAGAALSQRSGTSKAI